MTTVSIRFDVHRARVLAAERGWTIHEWAKQADTTYKTLTSFLKEDPRLKLITVEQIVRPLGICARDLIVQMDPNPLPPQVVNQ